MMFAQNFRIEFILHTHTASEQTVKNALTEFVQHMEISESKAAAPAQGRDLAVSLLTEEPTIIFDICSQFGRIRSVKIEEQGRA